MQSKSIPSTVASFLEAHGAAGLAADGLTDLHALVCVFRDAVPPEGSDPFSQGNLSYLTALLDCISVMSEELYEHYRALIDLFRAGVFRAPREKLLAYPSWNALREKGVRMGLLPEDLYGNNLPQPHLGVPEEYERMKGGVRK